jgi:hypothetical protein
MPVDDMTKVGIFAGVGLAVLAGGIYLLSSSSTSASAGTAGTVAQTSATLTLNPTTGSAVPTVADANAAIADVGFTANAVTGAGGNTFSVLAPTSAAALMTSTTFPVTSSGTQWQASFSNVTQTTSSV